MVDVLAQAARKAFARIPKPYRALPVCIPSLWALFALLRLDHYRAEHPILGVGLWVLLIYLSWIGWGSALATVLFPTRRLDWGLRGALGMAVAVFIGGLLGLLKWISPGAITTMVGAGLLALLVDGYLHGRASMKRTFRFSRTLTIVTWLALLFAWGAIAFRVFGSIADNDLNPWDDRISYVEFPVEMLGSGTLDEPFSIHRILSLGGKPFLDAMVLSHATIWNLRVTDGGLSLAVLFGLVLGQARAPARAWAASATIGGAMILSLALKPHNLGSEISGAVFFFALFRLLDARLDRERSWAVAAALGLVAAAACTMRQNFFLVVGAILAVHYLWSFFFPLRPRQTIVKETAWAAAATILALLPWLAFAYRSSGTLLYPTFAGNARPDFGLLDGATKAEELRFFIDNLTFEAPLGVGLTFSMLPILLRSERSTRATQTMFVGALLGGLGLIHALRALDDRESLGRYYFPFAFAYALAGAMVPISLACRAARAAPRYFAPAVVALAAVVVHLGATHDVLRDLFDAQLRAMVDRDDEKPADAHPELNEVYSSLQNSVPAGAPFLVLLDEPFRLDFRRNRIINFDQPGAVSPGAALPIGQGEEAFANFFLSHGIQFIAFRIDNGSPEYSRAKWQGHANSAPPAVRNGYTRGTLLHSMSRFYLDAFDNLTKLAASRHNLFKRDSYVVMDLKART